MNNSDITYLVTLSRVIRCFGILYEGVSFPEWNVTEDGFYCITYDGHEYIVAPCEVILTRQLTRLENMDPIDYAYFKRGDHTNDYVKELAKFGIDIKKNYFPQFRDGINPSKDNNKGYERKRVEKPDNT